MSKAGSSGVTVGVRPEHFKVSDSNEGLPFEVTVVEELGADAFIYGLSGVEGTPDTVVVRSEARRQIEKGQTLHAVAEPDRVHVFDKESGDRLN
jgi:multiple sugar transport system ATP-binding protein